MAVLFRCSLRAEVDFRIVSAGKEKTKTVKAPQALVCPNGNISLRGQATLTVEIHFLFVENKRLRGPGGVDW